MIELASEPNPPRSRLARRLMLRITLASIAITVALTTYVYYYAYREVEEQLRVSLLRLNSARASSESSAFAAAEGRLLLLRRVLLTRASEGVPRNEPKLDARWQLARDGLARTAQPSQAGRIAGAVWQPDSDPSRRAWADEVFGLLARYGADIASEYSAVYCIRLGEAAVTYSMHTDYSGAYRAEDFQPGGMLAVISDKSREGIRNKSVYWKQLYEDPFIHQWMMTAATLLDESGSRISYCALDLRVDDLLARSANPTLAGSFNLIINHDDELLVHPELLAKIKAAGGNLNIHGLKDPLLTAVDSASEQAGDNIRTVRDENTGNEYLMAVSRITGPDWRFVTLYSTRLIREQAQVVAQAVLLGCIAALLVGLFLLGLLLRHQVARPLGRLVDATRHIAAGEEAPLPPPCYDDEIGRLSEAIRCMGQIIGERGRSLVARASELEREVAERKSREEALRHVTEKLTLATEAALIGVWDYEIQTGHLDWDAQMFQMYGYGKHERAIAFAQWKERVHPEDWPKVKGWLRSASAGEIVRGEQEFRIVRSDGSVRHINCYGQLSFDEDGKPARITGVNVDITDRKHQEARIVHMATHDALTGLPNRNLLHDRIVQAMAAGERLNKQVAVLFIDLDRFKTINDSLGHSMGDALLIQAAQRLSGVLRKVDTLGRIGGDEFLVVLPFLDQAADAERVAEKILEGFSTPFTLGEQDCIVTPSIGLSVYPADGDTPETLVRNADTAMYRAKVKGRNTWQSYTAQMSEEASALLRMENDLRRALDTPGDELRLVYQPKHRLADGALVGAEALIRWHRPGFGLVAPDRFIPVAEERGLITAVSQWVLNETCRQLAAWRRVGLTPVPVAVNLDARQFSLPDLPSRILALLALHDVPASLLHLELTESALLLDERAVHDNLTRLRALGVRIAVDDFGTGFSSLSYLHRFPLDALKIDRSFIHEIGAAGTDTALVSAIIGIGHMLNLTVVAEGVENEEQLAFLRLHGCDEVQGFLFSPPVAADEFRTFIRRSEQTTS